MGFDEGHFVFANSNLTYYAGQIVSGKLVFDQSKNKTFRGKFVLFFYVYYLYLFSIPR